MVESVKVQVNLTLQTFHTIFSIMSHKIAAIKLVLVINFIPANKTRTIISA